MKRAGTRALAAAFVATSALGGTALTSATPAHALVVYPCHLTAETPGLYYGYVTGAGTGYCDGPAVRESINVQLQARPHGYTTWPMVVDQESEADVGTGLGFGVSAQCLHGTYDYRSVTVFDAGGGPWFQVSAIKTFSCK